MRCNCRYLFLISLLILFCIPAAAAERNGTLGISFGTNQAESNLHGFFLGLGADLLPWKHVGFGVDFSFHPVKQDYGNVQIRQIFYEFNSIFTPINNKNVVAKLKGGIGGAKTVFSEKQVCDRYYCSTKSLGSSDHFQFHASAGIEFYFSNKRDKDAFIRPEFNFRYIPNFSDEFGEDYVLGGTLWIGGRIGSQ